jgi:hypothetical protein
MASAEDGAAEKRDERKEWRRDGHVAGAGGGEAQENDVSSHIGKTAMTRWCPPT